MTRQILVETDKALVPLGKSESAYAVISLQDIKAVSKHSWHVGSDGYPRALVNGKNTHLHRFLINNPDKNKEIDHINRNRLDNRRENLRVGSLRQNAFNKRLYKNNKSGYRGVHFCNTSKKWVAQMSDVNQGVRKVVYLGAFININDAINARKRAEERIKF